MTVPKKRPQKQFSLKQEALDIIKSYAERLGVRESLALEQIIYEWANGEQGQLSSTHLPHRRFDKSVVKIEMIEHLVGDIKAELKNASL